ncbi:MAG: type IV pilus assembly protein PilM, partial [Thermodesulfobacteriota bacterium]|nr:type IV pilus assembly protein PilM [Thermodesulfobacteriota bacterium]
MGIFVSRKITGVDIGTDTIKAVQITSGLTGFKVTGFVKRKRSKEVSQDSVTILSREIREMLEDESLEGDMFVSSIPCDSVVIRNLELPFSNINKVRQVIRFEVEAILPFPLDDILVDFFVVNMKSPDKTDLLVMAAPKEVLKEHLGITREAGIESEIVDLDSTALFYCFKAIEDGKREGTSSIIDIGARKTSITIVRNGVLQFVRSIPVGGEDITQAISRELSVDRDTAEELKKRDGVILPCHIDPEDTNMETGSTEFTISKATVDALERLRRDVDLSFSFYESLNPDEKISEILLTGGTSKMRNIDKYLQREF